MAEMGRYIAAKLCCTGAGEPLPDPQTSSCPVSSFSQVPYEVKQRGEKCVPCLFAAWQSAEEGLERMESENLVIFCQTPAVLKQPGATAVQRL